MSDLVGVIGSGRFGLAMASVLANNSKVLLYSRNPETIAYINENHEHLGYKISKNIIGTHDLERVTEKCKLIFPIVPSQNFRDLMKELNSHLRARHILIHGTKGLDIHNISKEDFENGNFTNKDISSMSEVIRQETNVVRIGCLSGPNLSQEIMMRKPAAAVVASEFDEVVHAGQIALGCKYFFAFHSNDLRGTKLAGAFKNIIALASGILAGKELGKNLEALLITRGLNEMIHFGNSLGISGEAFLGTAGIGDLIATATSPLSRNYTFGFYLGQGADVNELMSNSSNTVEGVMTLKIIHHLAIKNKLELPIIIMLYKTIFEGYNIDKAVMYLMSNPMAVDVDFL
ncbi:MAG: NAD(P)H-dependent glycerol-3-phosphate dehydrogenase [Saprospiraceae bacterium]